MLTGGFQTRRSSSVNPSARASSSTDSVLMARAGYSVTTLVSFDHAKQLSNYHQMTDTAENLDYGTVADALEVTLAVAADLRR